MNKWNNANGYYTGTKIDSMPMAQVVVSQTDKKVGVSIRRSLQEKIGVPVDGTMRFQTFHVLRRLKLNAK